MGRGAGELGFERGLVVALVAHGILVMGLAFHRAAPRTATRNEGAPLDLQIETATEVQPTPAIAPAVTAAPPAEGKPLLASSGARREVVASLEAPAASASPTEPMEPGVVTGGGAGDWTVASTVRAAPDLGLTPGAGADAVRAGTRVSAREAARAAEAGGAMTSMKLALDAHDQDVGLGSGGPLVNLTRSAVRDSPTPTIGHALFELTTNGAGLVLSVRVLDASSSRKSWEEVAAKLAETSRTHPLRVPPGAKGVAVTLRVDSVLKTKSAHDAGETALSFFGVPLKRSNAEHPVRVDVAVPITSMNIDPTDALLDATSVPERVVSVWITREERL